LISEHLCRVLVQGQGTEHGLRLPVEHRQSRLDPKFHFDGSSLCLVQPGLNVIKLFFRCRYKINQSFPIWKVFFRVSLRFTSSPTTIIIRLSRKNLAVTNARAYFCAATKNKRFCNIGASTSTLTLPSAGRSWPSEDPFASCLSSVP
jgi:hypothetical protein